MLEEVLITQISILKACLVELQGLFYNFILFLIMGFYVHLCVGCMYM